MIMDDVKILRKLAYEYFKIAYSDKNFENIKLHKAVNDLKQIRPVVLIDELPWNEMNINNELTLQCSDEYLRKIEWFMRSSIYKNRYLPADMIVQPFIPTNKIINSTGIGISIDEEVLITNELSDIKSHKYKDVLKDEEDLAKLHNPVITYDMEKTLKRYYMVGEILGDILPVKLAGVGYFAVTTWDDIARYRGVTNLLIDLAERPEFMHKIVQKLTDFKLSEMDQIEAMDLLDNNAYSLHCTPIHTNDLPSANFNGEKLTRKDVWGRGAAQIFGTVSPAMHEEFDIEYMKKTIGQCGLAYYGCCEPLDNKIDILEKLPNLRKVSVTPWANVDIAAEAINTKYVLSAKPNPASVSVPMLDEDYLRKELGDILNACKRNNCSCDIVLKDISTCGKRPQNIFRWQEIAMEMVLNY